MENLSQGVTAFLQNFDMNLMPILFCYISQGKVNNNLTPLLQKCGEKAVRQCIKTPKHFYY